MLFCTVDSMFCRVFSSVGLERRLDRAEVTGSNPVIPTVECESGFECECECEERDGAEGEVTREGEKRARKSFISGYPG